MENTTQTVQIDNINANQLFDRLDQLEKKIENINVPVKNTDSDKFLTREQVAKRLQVSRQTLIVWQRKGVLKGYRIGTRIRYSAKEIDQLIIKRSKPE